MPSNDVPDSEEDSASHSPVYFSPVSSVSSLRSEELVRTHEDDEDVLFKLCGNLSTIPLRTFDIYLYTSPGAPSCSGSQLRVTSGRKEESEMFACFSTRNPRRFV